MTISGFESPIAAPIKHSEIKMLCCSKAFRARCFKGQGNARGNTMTERTALAGKDKLTSTTLLSDQRGAVAFEMPIVWLFLMMSLLLPLADLLSLAFSLYPRGGHCVNFGQYRSTRPDVTNVVSLGQRTHYGCGLSHQQSPSPLRRCTACSPSNSVSPKYYSYTTTVTLSPMVLRPVLCNANPLFVHTALLRTVPIGCSMHNLLRCRRGSAAFATVVALVPLIGVVALGGEAGSWYVTKQHAQNAADAAANSGGWSLVCSINAQKGVPCADTNSGLSR